MAVAARCAVTAGGQAAARAIVLREGWNAVAYQILNPGMRLWFSREGDAVAGYAVFGGVRVVAGAPVCPPARLAAVAAELHVDARAAGERLLFFAAGSRLEQVYAGHDDHRLVRVGALPVWEPQAWASIVRHKASLRAQLHRARNKGVHVEEWDAERATRSPLLRAVLREWLESRGLPPLSFLVTPDILDDLRDRRVFVAHCSDARGGAASGAHDVVGFLIATPVPARRGWLVEQWPRSHRAPNGTTHLLVDAAMRAFAADGAHYATLGLAPLSAQAGPVGAGQPAWLRALLRWVRAHGRRFYNFRGLEAFKGGMTPTRWEPVYVIAEGRRLSPRMLRAIAGVFSAGAPEALIGRALISAARLELRSLLRSGRMLVTRRASPV